MSEERRSAIAALRPETSFHFTLLRPEDLVAFDVECIELDLVTEHAGARDSATREARTTIRARPGRDSLLVLHLPPQHVGERAFYEVESTDQSPPGPPKGPDAPKLEPGSGSGSEPLDPPPIQARFANPSRLVFEVPTDHPPIEFTVEGVLQALGQLRMRIAWNAYAPDLFALPGNIAELVRDLLTQALGTRDEATTLQAVQALTLINTHLLARPEAGIPTARDAAGVRPSGRDSLHSSKLVGSIGAALDRLRLRPFPVEPGPRVTAIEAPYRLILSPNENARWNHAHRPVASSESGVRRVELWHSRLSNESVRAIWTRHRMESATHIPDPFRMSLDDRDRTMIVDLSSDYTLPQEKGAFTPRPIGVNRLMLSGLGAWIDVRGEWDARADGYSLAEWVHRAPMGRDQYVKVVYAGVLYPLRHPAALIKVTERRIERGSGKPIAYLFQHMYLVVRKPTMEYGAHSDFPYSSVRLTTLVTPQLRLPQESAIFPNRFVFWPTLADGTRFQFRAVGRDARGIESHFDTALVFIEDGALDASVAPLTTVQQAFTAAFGPDENPSDPDFHGQAVAFAPAGVPGDTTFETRSMGFDAQIKGFDFRPVMRRAAVSVPAVKNLTGKDDPVPVRYYSDYIANGFGAGDQVFLELLKPAGSASVDFAGAADRAGGLAQPNFNISGLSRVKGPVGGLLTTAQSGNFDPKTFFAGGNGPLLFGVFSLADVVSGIAPKFVNESLTAVGAFGADAGRLLALASDAGKFPGAGSLNPVRVALETAFDEIRIALAMLDLANPLPTTATFTALAAKTAPVLDAFVTQVAAAPVPKSLIDEIQSRGAVVSDLISPTGPVQTALAPIGAAAGLVDNLQRTRLEWSPTVTSFPNGSDSWIFGADAATRFTMSVEVRQASRDKPPGFDIASSLESFRIRLVPPMPLMVLHFDKIAFKSRNGKKPDVDVVFGGIEFVGILSFIETLKSVVPLDGFSDPPSLEVGPDGVKAGFSLAVPTVAVGVFSLENVSLGADFRVPFIGDPVSVGFNFCTRERPFTLTVSLLGGGGFFGIRVSPKGVMVLEAAIEFGAALSVNLGVASGSVSIMAGIYFRMENDACALTGYFRMRGEVDVLGLISAAIELYLGLTYEFSTGKMAGRASLTIEVEVLFFSTSVEVTCERKFAGAKGDPTFAQLMDPYGIGGPSSPWYEYCEAFAEA